jgi:anti-anti-sigma factor
MISALMSTLFFRPAASRGAPARAASKDAGPPDPASPPAPSRQAPEPAPSVEVTVNETADGTVIRVKGVAGVKQSGALLSGLLTPAARRPAVVTLDLSGLGSISSLAMGVLVAYRRGVVRAGGRVILAVGLQPAVREALARAELFDLFENARAA